MKTLFYITLFNTIFFSFGSWAITSEQKALLDAALIKEKKKIMQTLFESMDREIDPDIKYLEGAILSLHMYYHAVIKDGQGFEEETSGPLPISDVSLLEQKYRQVIHNKHFKYNMRRGLYRNQAVVNDTTTYPPTDNQAGVTLTTKRLLILFKEGLQDEGIDKGSFQHTGIYVPSGHANGTHTIGEGPHGTNLIAHVSVHYTYWLRLFTRNDPSKTKGRIDTDEKRSLKGAKVEYWRQGPGFQQDDVKQEVEVGENGKFSLKDIVTGDYKVTLKNFFCGCTTVVQEDQIFNPKLKTDQSLMLYSKRAEVTGRLLMDMEDPEPMKNVEVKLVPACEDADNCMEDVESVTTDEEGRFKFFDVPKGVYNFVYKGYTLGQVSNCELSAAHFDAGDFKVIMPMRYEVEMIHKGGARSSLKLLHVKWPEIIIRPISENVPLATLIASEDDPGNGRPVDTEGNPLTVPYVVQYPGYPQYDKTIYGVDMSDSPPEEIKIRTNYGTTCHLEQSSRAPMGIYLDYGDEPGSAVPYRRPLGHHFEADISLMCGGRMQVMMQFMTGHPEVPEFPDHYTALPLVPEDMLKNWQRCVDFDKDFSNKAGDHITFKFKCLGPEKLGEDSDNPPADPPGGCDDFEEDCGDNGGPTTPPSSNDNMPPGMGDGSGDGSLPPGMGDIIGGILGGLFGGN